VTPFGSLTAKARKTVEAESATVARAREVPDVTVIYS
jgi:hypothetical protein